MVMDSRETLCCQADRKLVAAVDRIAMRKKMKREEILLECIQEYVYEFNQGDQRMRHWKDSKYKLAKKISDIAAGGGKGRSSGKG